MSFTRSLTNSRYSGGKQTGGEMGVGRVCETEAEIIQSESSGEGSKTMGRLRGLEKRKKSKNSCSCNTY